MSTSLSSSDDGDENTSIETSWSTLDTKRLSCRWSALDRWLGRPTCMNNLPIPSQTAPKVHTVPLPLPIPSPYVFSNQLCHPYGTPVHIMSLYTHSRSKALLVIQYTPDQRMRATHQVTQSTFIHDFVKDNIKGHTVWQTAIATTPMPSPQSALGSPNDELDIQSVKITFKIKREN